MSEHRKFDHDDHDKREKSKINIHHHFIHCPMHMHMPMHMPCPGMMMPGQEMVMPVDQPMMDQVIPPAPATCAGQFYTVMRGETLTSIARKFGTTVTAILRVNPQITNPDVIFEGQRICLPVTGPPTPACPGGTVYVVMSGDTLFSIAARFGLTLSQLLAANPQITNPDVILAGQQICIPPVGPPPPTTCPGGTIYVVVSGDTLTSIARRFGTTVSAILAANPTITNPDLIFAGQRICIPAR